MSRMIILTLFLSLLACSKEETAPLRLMTVERQTASTSLFFSGAIQPIQTVVIPCPADGVIVDMPFQYGEAIQAKQLLFNLSSTKFLTDYKTALTAYVKAKSDFNSSQAQLAESTFLHQHQLISDEDYKNKQSSFYVSRLALLQAKDILEGLLRQLNMKEKTIYNLTIADIDQVTQALHLQAKSEQLHVVAPVAGVVLSAGKGEEEVKKLNKGDIVKQGDVLAVIGDMTGVRVRIKVNELIVNQLKVGQPVQVTGIAFPEQVLKGVIKQIDQQGESTSSGLPTFAVQVVVPTLTPQQRKEVHVGMSAKVKMDLTQDAQIMIPINAITERNGLSYVNVYDEKTKKTHEVEIKTGQTTLDAAVVLSSLEVGNRIVLPH